MSKFSLKVDEAMRKEEGLINACKICNGRTNQEIRIHTVYVPICFKCEDEVVIRSKKFNDMKKRMAHMIEMSSTKDKMYGEMEKENLQLKNIILSSGQTTAKLQKEIDDLSWDTPPPPKPEM